MTALCRCCVVAGVLGSASTGLAFPPSAAPQLLTLRTTDGVSIAAELRLPAVRPAPAVILVHMLTRTHEDWARTAEKLNEAGLVTLAIDLRGHGASGAAADSGDMNASVRDVVSARDFLRSRSDLCSGAIGIAGAQVGANLAVLAAASDAVIRSIALLSPGIEYRNLRPEAAMKKYNERPALLLASSEDAYANRSARALSTMGTGTRDFRVLIGAGHGTVMLARRPDLVDVLVDWFRRTLV